MPKSKKDKALITDKGVILDTCLLIESFANKCLMEEFFKYIKEEIKATIISIDPIYIEFVGGLGGDQNVSKEREKRFFKGTEWLAEITGKTLAVNEEALKLARELSALNCFAMSCDEYCKCCKKQPGPSLVDYLLGVMTSHEDVIVATSDHKDFPCYLYDRLYLKTFDLYDEICTVGFYKINEEKLEKLRKIAMEITKKIKTKK